MAAETLVSRAGEDLLGPAVRRYMTIVGVLGCLLVIFQLVESFWDLVDPRALFWIAALSLVELFPIRGWRGAEFTLAQPIAITMAILFSPPAMFVYGFIGTLDPREFKREIKLDRALFNRSQLGLAYFVASTVFHSMADLEGSLFGIYAGSVAAVTASYLVNVTLVAVAASLAYQLPFLRVVRSLRLGGTIEFLISYLSFGLLGALLAIVYTSIPAPEVAALAFLAPMILIARQLYVHLVNLEKESQLLRERSEALRILSDRIAEERHDERVRIAADLHDEVIPSILSLNLIANAGELSLRSGKQELAQRALQDMRQATDESLQLLRSVVTEMRRSPIGEGGLRGVLQQLVWEQERSTTARFSLELADVELSDGAQLFLYQIAREAMTNATRHADASRIEVSMRDTGDGVELIISDDGRGFDTTATPQGHFGLELMEERAQALCGNLEVESSPGHGTRVALRFRRQSRPEAEQ